MTNWSTIKKEVSDIVQEPIFAAGEVHRFVSYLGYRVAEKKP